jgi:poly-gamma-glutamate synthesis protein (capsule biosynthesis protein)
VSVVRLLEPAGPVRLRIAAAGDVGVIGSARERARREGYDAALAALAPALGGADLGFANLEFPIGEAAWVRGGRAPEFRHDEALPAALQRAGVCALSLANNHMMDCGERGLLRTLECCANAGLAVAGAGRTLEEARAPAWLEAGGARVALLARAVASSDAARAAAPGIAPLERERLREDLARWRPEAEVLVVSVHWGSMYVDYPPPRVLEIARAIEDEGADLVLGHHPHVLQGWRRRGRTLTLFSLGDAAFNPRAGDFEARVASATRRESAVFTALVAEEAGLECAPLTLDDDGLPGPAGAGAPAQIERLVRLAAGLDEAGARFASESAPRLLRYELESLGEYLRHGRLDRAARLIGSIRPRHLPMLWQAITRGARSRTGGEE